MREQFFIKIYNPFYYLNRWFRKLISKERCLHEKWNMDKQIRVIECRECGKQAWVDDYVDLFNKKNNE